MTKENYFSHRIRMLNNENRKILGEREVKTLLTVLDIEDHQLSLDGKRILDLGCGDQHLSEPIRARGAHYRGIDIKECNLEIEKFPLADKSFDIAISLALIEHLFDPGHFFAEINRVLKPGGVLWLDTPDIESCGNKFWNDPTHVHPYTRTSLKMALEMNGFRDVIVTPNFRCKPKKLYVGSNLNFFRARYLMPFAGTSKLPIPDFMKGHCTGLFAFARSSD